MATDSEVGEFIDDFLEHGGFYDPRKAHEYYMRTRKLVGRGAKNAKQVADNLLDGDQSPPRKSSFQRQEEREAALAKTATKRKAARQAQEYARQLEKDDREQRIALQQMKIDAARARARQASDEKRNVLEKKLDAIEKKLHKLKNPFKTDTKVTTYDVSGGGEPVKVTKKKRRFMPDTVTTSR